MEWRCRHIVSERNVADWGSRAADRGELAPGRVRSGRGAAGGQAAQLKAAPLPARCRPEKREKPDFDSVPQQVSCSFKKPRNVAPPKQHVLELFAGCGRLSACFKEIGCRILGPVDITRGPSCDLRDARIQRLILSWLRNKRVWFVHLGTPCTHWVPIGGAPRPSADDICLATFTVRVLRTCRAYGIFFGVESPWHSSLWQWAPLQKELARSSALPVRTDFCRFGTPYQKPTGIATNCPPLWGLAARCQCTSRHKVILQGTVRLASGKTCWRTTLANPYPPRWARGYARLAAAAAPPGAWRAPGEPTNFSTWDCALAASAGLAAPARRRAPTCPATFRLPWRAQSSVWAPRRGPAPARRSRRTPGSSAGGSGRAVVGLVPATPEAPRSNAGHLQRRRGRVRGLAPPGRPPGL